MGSPLRFAPGTYGLAAQAWWGVVDFFIGVHKTALPRHIEVRRHGFRDLQRALKKAARDEYDGLREEMRAAGEIVAAEARVRFMPIDPRSAAGFRPKVTMTAVKVYQARRKTTGKRPDYGALQMTRALIPARSAKTDEVLRRVGAALDRVCADFNNGVR